MKWTTEKRKLKDLIPYGSNPRILSEKQHKDLTASLKKFGLAEIPAIDTDNTLIAGHQRVKILSELNPPDFEIDVRVPDRKLTKKEFQEYNIRSNKNSGTWDFDILANEFEQDELIEWGFEEKELVGLFIDDKTDEELDDAPEPQKEAISNLGDMFLLDGKHRVMCGDSTKQEDVELLMDGKKANLYFTDPPYSVNYTKKAKEVLKSKNYVEIRNDNLSVEETSEIIWSPAFKNAYEICEDDASFYLTMPQGGDQMMMMMMMSQKWLVKHELIWIKEAPVFSMNRLDYDYQHEPIMYGWKKKHNFYREGNFQKSIWNIPRTENKLHPTMKPVTLIENAIKNSTMANCIVYDSFLGSGSTLIACEQTNRICYGMELDPIYVDVILKRYNKLYPDKEIKCLTRNVDFDKMFV